MDGNNRWAKQRGLSGIAGHRAGVECIRNILSGCREHGIEVLTVFAFSSENWQRPVKEVDALMSLFHHYLTNESKKLKKEGVRLRVIGNRERFSKKILKAIQSAEKITNGGDRTFIIAADYGGQWDIAQAAKTIAQQVMNGELAIHDIRQQSIQEATSLAGEPPLDLLIRTGGEKRISNFLLWQAAYAELYFSELLWPDFNREALDQAINDFNQRQRRFGLTSGQVVSTGNLQQGYSG
ncbi:di-trans,poly-cis-decaprenylcistransferase [Candidatus Endobugula sertula]|uniref:Ditrans,polycis-undecaprenyl-diphosphate synthase ((2E,6E)-farnesyl-diphosphate specific) n=1 Tax=Candidatus Endobugula sertula TaxID=62101 RepID=A0A1D2QQT9_9GAMM|nr:di-trans,poly-cis-decaprenylcistransferase [Candidatus Endobugula sertula]